MVNSPHSTQARFFIALMPPIAIQEYANTLIQELSDRYQTQIAAAPPHVTIQAPFLWQLEAAADLERCLQTFAQPIAPVSVELAGFGAFAPRVLYINVLKTPDLLALQAKLLAHLESQLHIIDPVAKSRPFTPHLTLASRKLTRQTFQQAWEALQTRSIAMTFRCDRLTLLHHDGQLWQVRSEMKLKG
jgi:2'-5' RNA ligase